LRDVCADLAARAAKAIEDGHETTIAEPVQQMMVSLGCMSKMPGQ